jgi:hypothetical protein
MYQMGEIERRGGDLATLGSVGTSADPRDYESSDEATRSWLALKDVPKSVLTAMTQRGLFPQSLYFFVTLEPKLKVTKGVPLEVMSGWLIGDDRVTHVKFSQSLDGTWSCDGEVRPFAELATVKRAQFEADGPTTEADGASESSKSAIDFGNAEVLPSAVRQQLAALFPWTRFEVKMLFSGTDFPATARQNHGYSIDCIAEGRGQVLAIEAERHVRLPDGASRTQADALIGVTPWTVRAVHGVLA